MFRARSNTVGNGSSTYGPPLEPLEPPRLSRQRSLQLKHSDSIPSLSKAFHKHTPSVVGGTATPPRSPVANEMEFRPFDMKAAEMRSPADSIRSIDSLRSSGEFKPSPGIPPPSHRSMLLHNIPPAVSHPPRLTPRSHPNSVSSTPQLQPSPKFLRDTNKADTVPIVPTYNTAPQQRPELLRAGTDARSALDRSSSYSAVDARAADRLSFASSSIYQSPVQAGPSTSFPEEVDEARNLLPPLPTPQDSSFPNSPSDDYGFNKVSASLPVSPAQTRHASIESASLASDFDELSVDQRSNRQRSTSIPSWIQRCDTYTTYNSESDYHDNDGGDGDNEDFDENDDEGDNDDESEIDMQAFSMHSTADSNDLWESGAESCPAAPEVPSIKERRSFRKKRGHKKLHLQLSGLGSPFLNGSSSTSVSSAPAAPDYESNNNNNNNNNSNVGLGFTISPNSTPLSSLSSSKLLKNFGSTLKRKVSNTPKPPKRSQSATAGLATVPDVPPHSERSSISYSTAPSVWGGHGDDDNDKELSDYFDKAMEVIEAVKRKRSSRGNKRQQQQQQQGVKSSHSPDSDTHDDSLSESTHSHFRRQYRGDYFGIEGADASSSNPTSVMSTPAAVCPVNSTASAPGATPCTPCTPNSLSALRKEIYDGVPTNEYADLTIRKHHASTSQSSTEGEGTMSPRLGSSVSSTHDGVATGEGGILPYELAPTEEECCNMSSDEMTCRMIASQELFESTRKRLAESGWYDQSQIDEIQKNGRQIHDSWRALIDKRQLQEKAQAAQAQGQPQNELYNVAR
ncbi:YALIA101S02e22012g1_1 [Yarrowia lipolytica]|nr:YALIA101S02e22012g1_1 [Yarrowia lipolytica]